VYLRLVSVGGVGARNCFGLSRVKGVTVASQGASIGDRVGGGPGRNEGGWTPNADVIAAGERREGGVSGIALSLRSINRTGFGTLAGGHSTQYSSLANSLMHIPEQPNVRRRFSQKWSCFLGVEQHSRDTHKAYLRHTF